MWTDRSARSIISPQSHKKLTQDLLRNLGRENLKELKGLLGNKADIDIDIFDKKGKIKNIKIRSLPRTF